MCVWKKRGAYVVRGSLGCVVVGYPSSSTSGRRGGDGEEPGEGGGEEELEEL